MRVPCLKFTCICLCRTLMKDGYGGVIEKGTLRFCDQMWSNYRISLVGYHCSIVASTPHSIPVQTHTHCTHGTCGVLHCLLFCDQTRPNLRISLVGYHCSIEFPCGVPLFYCCKYPTTYGVRVHTSLTHTHTPLLMANK